MDEWGCLMCRCRSGKWFVNDDDDKYDDCKEEVIWNVKLYFNVFMGLFDMLGY